MLQPFSFAAMSWPAVERFADDDQAQYYQQLVSDYFAAASAPRGRARLSYALSASSSERDYVLAKTDVAERAINAYMCCRCPPAEASLDVRRLLCLLSYPGANGRHLLDDGAVAQHRCDVRAASERVLARYVVVRLFYAGLEQLVVDLNSGAAESAGAARLHAVAQQASFLSNERSRAASRMALRDTNVASTLAAVAVHPRASDALRRAAADLLAQLAQIPVAWRAQAVEPQWLAAVAELVWTLRQSFPPRRQPEAAHAAGSS